MVSVKWQIAFPTAQHSVIASPRAHLQATSDLGPPLAGGGRLGHDHQISVEVFRDLDLGALRHSNTSSRSSFGMTHAGAEWEGAFP